MTVDAARPDAATLTHAGSVAPHTLPSLVHLGNRLALLDGPGLRLAHQTLRPSQCRSGLTLVTKLSAICRLEYTVVMLLVIDAYAMSWSW